MSAPQNWRKLREEMVSHQLASRGIIDKAIIHAFLSVPRHLFVPAKRQNQAYDDSPLPLPDGQTISQPFIVAYMIQAGQIKSNHRVLEIGAGSGYAAAIVSMVARTVYAVERHQSLAAYAQKRFDRLGYDNIHIRHADGSLGWAEHAPYDAILVSAASPIIPSALKEQLAINGRLIIPIGVASGDQTLTRITKISCQRFETRNLTSVRFVPLIGAEGWSEQIREA